MNPRSELLELLLWPGLWWFFLALWVVVWVRSRVTPPVTKEFNRKTARSGDLFADGSSATSKTEMRVRWVIQKAGYRVYPQSTRLLTPPDHSGKRHKYTPDVMLWKPKMVVEVDPHFWHGDNDRIAHDLDRNRMYARLGYTVVRVRIAGTEALSPNDVVITDSDFDIAKHGPAVVKAIRKAKYLPPRHWDSPQRYMRSTQPNPKPAKRRWRVFG